MEQETGSLEIEEIRAFSKKLNNNLVFFAENVLIIKDKEGDYKNLRFTEGQQLIHAKVEDQLRRIGKVRVIVVKSRQVGSSTYFTARHYHKITRNPGKNGYLIAHQEKTTILISEMIRRYYDRSNVLLRPPASNRDKFNDKKIYFASLDSGYELSTASSRKGGRGGTVQFFHGSEVAYWDDMASTCAGALNQVPDAPGTEIFGRY